MVTVVQRDYLEPKLGWLDDRPADRMTVMAVGALQPWTVIFYTALRTPFGGKDAVVGLRENLGVEARIFEGPFQSDEFSVHGM